MNSRSLESSHYDSLRSGGKTLSRLATLVQLGLLLVGFGLFLDQSRDLLSDAQFTWGERRVMGIEALVTLAGCALVGLILGRLIRVAAEVIEVLADGAEAAWRTGDLIEQHLVPTMGRIALALEEQDRSSTTRTFQPSSSVDVASLRKELSAAQAAGRAGRVFDLRDALTRHLHGEVLHNLDRDLAFWLLELVQRRIQSNAVDAELAGWVALALDSLGAMTEADPLRQVLPELRRRSALCLECGRPRHGANLRCALCRSVSISAKTGAGAGARSPSTQESP
jgi:hypothetical protein